MNIKTTRLLNRLEKRIGDSDQAVLTDAKAEIERLAEQHDVEWKLLYAIFNSDVELGDELNKRMHAYIDKDMDGAKA